jgi:hypothetical protein
LFATARNPLELGGLVTHDLSIKTTDEQMTSEHVDSAEKRPSSILFLVVLVAGLIAAGYLYTRPVPVPIEETREVLLSFTARTNGRIYVSGSPDALTGRVVEYYRGGGLKSRTQVSNGLLHGLSEGWFTNGVKQVDEPFQQGKSHGLRTKWYASGKKLSEANIVDGVLSGPFRKWHENGQLSQEIEMQNGEAHGRSRAWFESGYLKALVTLTNGVVVEQTFYEDGQQKDTPEG